MNDDAELEPSTACNDPHALISEAMLARLGSEQRWGLCGNYSDIAGIGQQCRLTRPRS